jgi:adenosylcobinamide kinase/adenosylcobinamide-phosphate guanylyltransferase
MKRIVPNFTLVLGGARSGKSRYAEALVTAHASPWVYLATGQAFDDEMRARIAGHQASRSPCWQTIEAPVDLHTPLIKHAGRPVLVDCLTLWLTNLMLADHDVAAATASLHMALAGREAPTVLVSNEVGLGIVPETPLGRAFRDAAGRLHQRLATQAGHVILMVAGLPLTVK